MLIKLAPTRHRTLTTDVQVGERVHLSGVWNAGDHAELLLYAGVRGRSLHTPKFQRGALVPVKIGQDGRCRNGLGGKAKRRLASHHTCRLGDWRPIFGDQGASHAVVCLYAFDIVLHHLNARHRPGPDGRVQRVNCCLFQTKRLLCPLFFRHDVASISASLLNHVMKWWHCNRFWHSEAVLKPTALGIAALASASTSSRTLRTLRFFVAARLALPALVTVFHTGSQGLAKPVRRDFNRLQHDHKV